MPIIVIAVIFVVGIWILRYVKNENSPILSEQATLIRKYGDEHGSFLKFRLSSGGTLRLSVGFFVYHKMKKNDSGILTYQGTRFIKFQGPSGTVEK